MRATPSACAPAPAPAGHTTPRAAFASCPPSGPSSASPPRSGPAHDRASATTRAGTGPPRPEPPGGRRLAMPDPPIAPPAPAEAQQLPLDFATPRFTIAHHEPLVTLYHGDCVEVMASLPAQSIDAIVTDPPYGLEFMGNDW